MATQCGPFVSSSVYYGYVQQPAPQAQQTNVNNQQQQQQYHIQQQYTGMEMECDTTEIKRQEKLVAEVQEQRNRKRAFEALPQDFDYETYNVMPRFKRFREEAVVTNVFSMVQGTGTGHQRSVDWPRCTMSRYYA